MPQLMSPHQRLGSSAAANASAIKFVALSLEDSSASFQPQLTRQHNTTQAASADSVFASIKLRLSEDARLT
jgi:hypothetical protein